MLRLIAAILATIFAISILRAVIGLVMKAFANMVGPDLARASPQGEPQPPSSTASATSELKKDPVCGTYVLAATAVKKTSGGQTIYFCSTDCRDKHSA